jgi:gas vesicle protein
MTLKTQQEFLLGALIGGAVGATAALFLTPLSGADLRKRVSRRASGVDSKGIIGPRRKKEAAKAKELPLKAVKQRKKISKKPAHHSHHTAKE